MSVAITGAGGFLGWHTRALLHVTGETDVRRFSLGRAFDTRAALNAIHGVDRVLHLAEVTCAPDDEIGRGNRALAGQLAGAIRAADAPPRTVVFAGSVQAGDGTVYGQAKAAARDVLMAAALEVGAEFVDVVLPDVFGEHGLPFSSSVAATFCHLLSTGRRPVVREDRELTLLHVHDAASVLVGFEHAEAVADLATRSSVTDLRDRLTLMAGLAARGDLPDLSSTFDRDLFNTLRSSVFEVRPTLETKGAPDARGRVTPLVRSHGGPAQTALSITLPGESRGRHVHLRKVERLVVLGGSARVRMRRLLSDEIVEFDVSGGRPTTVDVPTLWSHEIVNTGSTPLATLTWSNELETQRNCDTYDEPV